MRARTMEEITLDVKFPPLSIRGKPALQKSSIVSLTVFFWLFLNWDLVILVSLSLSVIFGSLIHNPLSLVCSFTISKSLLLTSLTPKLGVKVPTVYAWYSP